MQQLLDYIAILAFVVIYFLTSDIFIATAVLMVGVTVQLGAYWLLKKPIGNELKLTFWASIVFGGMTLILRDETFIQWKPTIVNWLLSYPDQCIQHPHDALANQQEEAPLAIAPSISQNIQVILSSNRSATNKLRAIASNCNIIWRNAHGHNKHLSNKEIRAALAQFPAILKQL